MARGSPNGHWVQARIPSWTVAFFEEPDYDDITSRTHVISKWIHAILQFRESERKNKQAEKGSSTGSCKVKVSKLYLKPSEHLNHNMHPWINLVRPLHPNLKSCNLEVCHPENRPLQPVISVAPRAPLCLSHKAGKHLHQEAWVWGRSVTWKTWRKAKW